MDKRPARLLLVDDDERNLKLIEALLQAEGYETESAASGEAALDCVAARPPDLILLDVMMPGMSGYEVARRLKKTPSSKAIPIIMLTALSDKNARLEALNSGAEEFLSKPVDRAELWVRVRNLLRLKEYNDFLAGYARILEDKVQERTAQIASLYQETLAILGRAAAYRDEETGAHVARISYYCVEMSDALGMDAGFRDAIFHASPLHDVGKIATPDRILFKPGGLTSDEWRIMQRHAENGAKMLENAESPYLQMGREIALSHHERWDGSGYPQGIEGEQIPLSARLMCLADVYDALRSRRPYKPAFDHDQATAIILQGDGRTIHGHFDPQVLAAFRTRLAQFNEIYQGLTSN